MDLSSINTAVPAATSPGFDPTNPTARANALQQVQDFEQADQLALLGPSAVLSGSLQAALLGNQALAGQAAPTPGTPDPTLQAGLREASLVQTGMLDSTLLGSVPQNGLLQAYSGMAESGLGLGDGGGFMQAGLLESLAEVQPDTLSGAGTSPGTATGQDPAAPPAPPLAGSGPLGTQVNTYA